jgi:hypothetical protein
LLGGLWVRSYFRNESIAFVDDIDDGTYRHIFIVDMPDRPKWSQSMWHDELKFSSGNGLVAVRHKRSDVYFRSGSWLPKGRHYQLHDPVFWVFSGKQPGWMGFYYAYSGSGPPPSPRPLHMWGYERILTFPYWCPCLLLSAPPTAVLVTRWRRKRRFLTQRDAAAQPCAACGYDLRATPDRCPECGTAAAAD